jgi:hypothetical protein
MKKYILNKYPGLLNYVRETHYRVASFYLSDSLCPITKALNLLDPIMESFEDKDSLFFKLLGYICIIFILIPWAVIMFLLLFLYWVGFYILYIPLFMIGLIGNANYNLLDEIERNIYLILYNVPSKKKIQISEKFITEMIEVEKQIIEIEAKLKTYPPMVTVHSNGYRFFMPYPDHILDNPDEYTEEAVTHANQCVDLCRRRDITVMDMEDIVLFIDNKIKEKKIKEEAKKHLNFTWIYGIKEFKDTNYLKNHE